MDIVFLLLLFGFFAASLGLIALARTLLAPGARK